MKNYELKNRNTGKWIDDASLLQRREEQMQRVSQEKTNQQIVFISNIARLFIGYTILLF